MVRPGCVAAFSTSELGGELEVIIVGCLLLPRCVVTVGAVHLQQLFTGTACDTTSRRVLFCPRLELCSKARCVLLNTSNFFLHNSSLKLLTPKLFEGRCCCRLLLYVWPLTRNNHAFHVRK